MPPPLPALAGSSTAFHVVRELPSAEMGKVTAFICSEGRRGAEHGRLDQSQ